MVFDIRVRDQHDRLWGYSAAAGELQRWNGNSNVLILALLEICGVPSLF
jgi:hypothetical protein